jgi:hypothetical protein
MVFSFCLPALTSKDPVLVVVALGILLFYVLVAIFAIYVQTRVYKRAEKRRQQAMAGDQSLLFNPQFKPEEQPLQLSMALERVMNTKLVLRTNKTYFLLMTGPYLFLCLLSMFGKISQDRWGIGLLLIYSSLSTAALVGAIIECLLTIGVISVLIFLWLARQEIGIDERGVTSTYLGKTTTVPWDEARCFDLWGPKTTYGFQYELIGEHSVVRWQIPNPNQTFQLFKPTIPRQEFDYRLGSMHQVITAKTGLLLYDLRDKKLVLH